MHNRITQLLKKFAVKTMDTATTRGSRNQRHFFQQTAIRFNQTSLYAGIFSHTMKEIPQYYAAVTVNQPALQELRQAIASGDHGAKIFSDPQCSTYLLQLLKDNVIPFWQGITVYGYIMGLMQFTLKQPMHPADISLKHLPLVDLTFKVEALTLDNQITPVGEKYLKEIIKNFEKIYVHLDYVECSQFFLTLAPVECWLMLTHYDSRKPFATKYDEFSEILVSNIPFLQHVKINQQSYHLMPSLRVIQFLLSKVTLQPLTMQPILGQISADDFYHLHESGCHPLALYSPLDYNNLNEPHGYAVGPYSVFQHDIGHTLWGSMLRAADRKKLFAEFIPQLKILSREAQDYTQQFLSGQKPLPFISLPDRMKLALQKAVDFDLTELKDFRIPDQRFVRYLGRTMGIYQEHFLYASRLTGYESNNIKIGECVEDHLYFLLKKSTYRAGVLQEETETWKIFIEKIDKEIDEYHRHPDIIKALDTLARLACGMEMKTDDLEKTAIDWAAWLELLTESKDVNHFWHAAKRQRHTELLILINEYHIKFFHPALSFDAAELKIFENFLRQKVLDDLDFSQRYSIK